ncbi:acyltransferase domain-containing protein [Tardiphaga sp. 709]|uniref:acyltransferase domain-containing protein n=1 Tax=Tardiphaga sp. 709 TaxID=3076039 RepID=UPI0028E28852|nr:acyltransferase domain-containing protein [Tardiphaga sp. 709]WNV11790.1 acyltransferase domain-containing protein [Tardiphaga sp. 709]
MLALLCGGQGSLSPEIFDLVANQPAAEPILVAATACLGHDPRELIRTRDADDLSTNHVSQLLSVTAALATHACVADLLSEQTAVTGYSVGEMAAWSIAGIWGPDEVLRLTDIRARLMDSAAGKNGRLGYVRGLDRNTLQRLLDKHHCAIAITNPGALFVVGGTERDVTDLCHEATAEGAPRAGLLAVKVASHTAQLEPACEPFRQALDSSRHSPVASNRILLAGTDGERIFSETDAMAKLASQIARPVEWATTLQALVELGTDSVLDLGPGHALADMMHTLMPSIRCYSADGFRTLDGLRNWIASR